MLTSRLAGDGLSHARNSLSPDTLPVANVLMNFRVWNSKFHFDVCDSDFCSTVTFANQGSVMLLADSDCDNDDNSLT